MDSLNSEFIQLYGHFGLGNSIKGNSLLSFNSSDSHFSSILFALIFFGFKIQLPHDFGMIRALASIIHIKVTKNKQIVKLVLVPHPVINGHLFERFQLWLFKLSPLFMNKFENLFRLQIRILLANILKHLAHEKIIGTSDLFWLEHCLNKL